MKRDKSQYYRYENVFRDKKYRLIVLDMDGTLYFQRKMQFLMCCEMLFFALAHPSACWKLKVISVFRKIREEKMNFNERETDAGGFLEKQYEKTAKAVGKSADEVREVIEEWILKRPLKHIVACRDVRLCRRILKWQQEGVKVVVYSDYPAKAKCDALEIKPDAVYSSEEERIGQMKPSSKAIEVIAGDFKIMPQEMLIIGDRYSKDGKMAENAEADYLILEKWKRRRNRKWHEFTNFK